MPRPRRRVKAGITGRMGRSPPAAIETVMAPFVTRPPQTPRIEVHFVEEAGNASATARQGDVKIVLTTDGMRFFSSLLYPPNVWRSRASHPLGRLGSVDVSELG